MKYLKISMVLCFLLTLFNSVSKAQDSVKISVRAVVRGANGDPIRGASVVGETVNTTTDDRGMFSVEVKPEAILTVSAEGHKSSLVVAGPDLTKVELKKDVRLVPVAFKSVDEADLPSGVSNVNVGQLLQKNYFTYGVDGLQAFAPGFLGGNNIWGMGSLVLIDGVPRDLTSITANEIDQVTFLKSASAIALYGSRGARGVTLITTKRGTESDQKINVRSNAGLNVPKMFPKYLGSSEYMTLYNEARVNDGLGILYSPETIYNHANGNPYRYPNVDYYSSDYIKSSYGRYDAITEIYGGNDRARYYTNLGFIQNGSLLNFGEAEKNNTGQRFNIRGNVDMKLNKIFKARVDATAAFSNDKGVNTDYWLNAASMRPDRFAPLIPISFLEESDQASLATVGAANVIDGKYVLGGNSVYQTNTIGTVYAGGSNKYVQREFQFTTGIEADLNSLLKGLNFSTTMGIDYFNLYNQGYRNGYATYEPVWTSYNGTDKIASFKPAFGSDTRSGNQTIADSWYRQTISLSSQLNYNRVLNDKHNLSAILMGAAYRQAISETYQPTTNSNLGLQLGYNFNRKYYAELTGAVVRSPKLAPGNRVAFSPAASIGWRISEEPFLKNVSFLNNLKLSASAGILNTDLDITEYFLYESIYVGTGSYFGWYDGSGTQQTESRRGNNPNLEMAKREEISLGLEGAMFSNHLAFGANFFRNTFTGIPLQSTVLYPSYFQTNFPTSSFIPWANYNSDQRTGFDFNLNIKQRTGSVNWIVGTAATYFKTKATKRAENFADAYQNRQGKPLDALFGLQSDGFYMDAGEVAAADGVNAPKPAFGPIAPGDIRYVDQNGDKIINDRDQIYLGRAGWSGSPLTLGLNLTANWKNFTVFALATGQYGGYRFKDNNYYWVNGEDKYSEVVRDRWTEATKNTATFPRLTTTGGDNNFRASDFWMYSTDRLDLSKVQLSYNLSSKVLKSKYVRDLGVYVSGFNLLTAAKERKVLETMVGQAPQTRMYNLGIKAQF